MDADVEHLEFEHTPDGHRPFMLVAFAGGEALQLWLTEQQVSEIWTKAMAPLMAYRSVTSTPGLANDMAMVGEKDVVMTSGFFNFLTEHPISEPRVKNAVGKLFKRQDEKGQWWFCEPLNRQTPKGYNYVHWRWLPIVAVLAGP